MKRLVTALESAGSRDMPPVRALAAAAAAVAAILKGAGKKSEGTRK